MKTHVTRKLRRDQTPHESKLWYNLRSRNLQGLKFRRQYKIGPYVVDFFCPSKKLVIELDGGHHVEGEVSLRDQKEQKYVESQGYHMLRFWNSDVDSSLEDILNEILRACELGD